MLLFVLAQKPKKINGNQQGCWSKNLDRILLFALEQDFRKYISKVLAYFCLVMVLVTPQEQPSPPPLLVKIWTMNSGVKIYPAARNLLVDK